MPGVTMSNLSQWCFAAQPEFTRHPRTQRVSPAANLVLYSSAEGTLDYQWFRDGVMLSDGLGISGSATDTLTIEGVGASDAGKYTLEASSTAGHVMSRIAMVTIADPSPGASIASP